MGGLNVSRTLNGIELTLCDVEDVKRGASDVSKLFETLIKFCVHLNGLKDVSHLSQKRSSKQSEVRNRVSSWGLLLTKWLWYWWCSGRSIGGDGQWCDRCSNRDIGGDGQWINRISRSSDHWVTRISRRGRIIIIIIICGIIIIWIIQIIIAMVRHFSKNVICLWIKSVYGAINLL